MSTGVCAPWTPVRVQIQSKINTPTYVWKCIKWLYRNKLYTSRLSTATLLFLFTEIFPSSSTPSASCYYQLCQILVVSAPDFSQTLHHFLTVFEEENACSSKFNISHYVTFYNRLQHGLTKVSTLPFCLLHYKITVKQTELLLFFQYKGVI